MEGVVELQTKVGEEKKRKKKEVQFNCKTRRFVALNIPQYNHTYRSETILEAIFHAKHKKPNMSNMCIQFAQHMQKSSFACTDLYNSTYKYQKHLFSPHWLPVQYNEFTLIFTNHLF